MTRVPQVQGAQPGDARATAPARAAAGLRGRGDRAPSRDAGSVAAGAVRRALVAHLRVQARAARARHPLGQGREGIGDARHPPPRDRAGLPAVLRGAGRGCGRGATRSRWSSDGSSCRRCGRSSRTGPPHVSAGDGTPRADARRVRRADSAARVVCRTHGRARAAFPGTALWSAKPQALFAAIDEPEVVDTTPARAELVRRYLGALGRRRTAQDFTVWSGMRVSDFAEAFEALEPLRRFHAEDGRELLDIQRAPLPAADTPAPVRFLPKWDNVLLGFADRTRVLPEEYRKTVITKNGDVAQTFSSTESLRAAGGTRTAKSRSSLRALPPRRRRELEGERHGSRIRVLIALHAGGVKSALDTAVEIGRRHCQLLRAEPTRWKPPTPEPQLFEEFPRNVRRPRLEQSSATRSTSSTWPPRTTRSTRRASPRYQARWTSPRDQADKSSSTSAPASAPASARARARLPRDGAGARHCSEARRC